MTKIIQISLLLGWCILIVACKHTNSQENKSSETVSDTNLVVASNGNSGINLWRDYKPLYSDGDINVVIEISTGTTEKWEVEKQHGTLKLEHIDDKPRIIQYLGYPANYGMIPRTLLPKELGGDGDPLDVIVLGAPVERGQVVKCKLIGVLYLVDRGEQDDKLIAVIEGTPLL